MKIKDLTFEVVDAGEFLRITMLPEMAWKYHKEEGISYFGSTK